MNRRERRKKEAEDRPYKVSGKTAAVLANGFSDVVNLALRSGMKPDECVCIMAAIVADYARYHYGDEYLEKLALVVTERAGEPIPGVETQH